MKTEENKQLVKKIFNEAFNNRNLSAIDSLVGDTYVNRSMPGSNKGSAGLKEILQQFTGAFPDMKINVEHVIGDDNMVATHGYWTGTNQGSFMGMPATNKQVRIEYIDLWKIENGKAVENWVQMDMMGMMQQLGMMPQPA